MDPGQTARYVMMFASWVCVIEVIAFLITYWRVVIPLRKHTHVMAPPVFWTAAYHAFVGLYCATSATSVLLRMRMDAPVLWTTYLLAAIAIVLAVIYKEFLFYYLKILRSDQPTAIT